MQVRWIRQVAAALTVAGWAGPIVAQTPAPAVRVEAPNPLAAEPAARPAVIPALVTDRPPAVECQGCQPVPFTPFMLGDFVGPVGNLFTNFKIAEGESPRPVD